MERNRFIFLLVLIVIYGGSVGGSFALGRNSVALEPGSTQMPTNVLSETNRTDVSNNDIASIREKIQSGELTREDLQNLRNSEFRNEQSMNRPAVIGTIKEIDRTSLKLETARGELEIDINQDTKINKPVRIRIEDLNVGTRISVSGLLEEGEPRAHSIQVLE